jgi:hypothetical protein
MYFRHWNRHSPVLHHGTFDAEKVSLPLLLMVVVTGALFSLSHDEVAMARNMLQLAEEYTFQNPAFVALLSGMAPKGPTEFRLALEALQAAFSAAQVQLREGIQENRRRIRSLRFRDIISVRPVQFNQSCANCVPFRVRGFWVFCIGRIHFFQQG